jgi:hypothetical protein
MFAEVQQFQALSYSWFDQNKNKDRDWKAAMAKTQEGFCGRRHCHWTEFYDAWEDHVWGTDGKICNNFDETGCNPPGAVKQYVKEAH